MAPRGAAPLVTVIVATFNCGSMLRFALESVRRQELEDFEAWVVGDGCSDDSEEVVVALGDSRFRWQNLDRNSGSQAAPNNAALRLARGKYVAYLGHDDLWFPWHLSELIRAMEEKGSDLVHSLCGLVGPEGAREATGPPKPGVTYESHFVPPSSWLHRTELRESCGYWGNPNRLPIMVDRDYLRRMHRAGKRVSFLPHLTVLKFPSMWWGHYRPTGERPQRRYLEALASDPAQVERDVLRELAIEGARQRYGGRESLLRTAKRAAWLFYDVPMRRWGEDRWPISSLMLWYHQHCRKSIRALRGL